MIEPLHALGRVRVFVAVCAAALALIAPRSVRGQEVGGGHGWFVVEPRGEESNAGEGEGAGGRGAARCSIVHLPPPDRLSPRGSIRVVQGLTRAPERLAWGGGGAGADGVGGGGGGDGRTLFILMPGERVAENEVARRVYSITAAPGLVSGWEYIPAERPETLPTLGGPQWGARDLEVVGFAAGVAGTPTPVVLMKRKERGGTAYLLVYLAIDGWKEAGLPWQGEAGGVDAPGADDTCRLITAGGTFGVLIERGGGEEDARADGGAGRRAEWCVASGVDDGDGKGEGIRWRVREVVSNPPVSPGVGSGGEDDFVCVVDTQLVRVTLHGSSATLSILRESDEYVLTTVTGLAEGEGRVRIAPVDGSSGFIALLSEWDGRDGGEGGASEKKEAAYRLVEVTPGRRVLFDGPAKQGGPVSVREIQLLTVLLVLVLGTVMVFVMRPEKKGAGGDAKGGKGPGMALPAGLAPAESGRRIMATVLDLGASWVVASMVMRIDLADVARPELLFSTGRGWVAVGIALGLTLVMGVLLEWQFGLTLGKLMLGCRVMRVVKSNEPSGAATGEEGAGEGVGGRARKVGGVQPPSLWGAMVRNVGKWTPWSVMEFVITGRSRHWADRMAGTVVVVADGAEGEGGTNSK